MSKILFGQSYYLKFDLKLWRAMQPYPPLGTLYAASFMREHGYEVALFDAMLAESEAEWAAALDREKPAYAVIFEDNFNYLSKMCLLRMRQAAFTMIEMAKARGVTTIICGSDATDHAQKYLEQGADFVLIGEGEYTLRDLLERLDGRSHTPFTDMPGLAFTPSPPHLLTTPRRPDIKELDALPFPAWDLVDVPRYQKIWYERHGYYSMNMVTTRGCPFHCNWCAKPIWGQRYNVRSPENVVAELKWLKETYHPDHIWFADDIMGLKPGWLEKFGALVEKENARVPFKCLSRADLLVRGQTITGLRRAGCQIVWMGAESGSQAILNAMEKGTTIEQIHEATARLQAAGVQIGFFLQFGYPGETRADVEKTLQLVRDCNPDDIGMSVSYPLPGTKFYERVKVELIDKQNWVDSSDLDMMYQGPFTTAFYRQLHVVLHKEFRAHKAWQMWKQTWRQPGQLRPYHLRRLAGAIYRRLTLPLARRKLNRLAAVPHENKLVSLTPALTLDEAARPSPQGE
jgi:anaerobic magnesium-protoporphyrin IX monomethyl ester cyclase